MNRTSAPAGHVASSRSGAGWSGPGLRRKVVVALVVWTLPYACYRAYYAAGGEFGMIGQPVSTAQIRAINAVGAAIIGAAAILPLLAMRVRVLRRALPVLGWIAAVGCCMHALVDWTLRVLSLTGVHPTQLPASVWRSFGRRAADLQDLLVNEPWFFVEGLLWGTLAVGLIPRSRRRPWIVSAVTAACCSPSSAFSAASA
jgi:hypothetical protein